MFYHSYMAAFEIPSSNNVRRSSSSSCCRVKPCSFDEVLTTSTERISYLLPYSSTEGVHKVLPAETRNVIVKSWSATGTHDVRHAHPTSEWSNDAYTELWRYFHHDMAYYGVSLHRWVKNFLSYGPTLLGSKNVRTFTPHAENTPGDAVMHESSRENDFLDIQIFRWSRLYIG